MNDLFLIKNQTTMKKKNVKVLHLQKRAISKMNDLQIVGGNNQTNSLCTSAAYIPQCFLERTKFNTCGC